MPPRHNEPPRPGPRGGAPRGGAPRGDGRAARPGPPGDKPKTRRQPPPPKRADTYEEASAYVQPTPEDQLTEADRLEVRTLDALGNTAFDRRVNDWVSKATPDPAGDRVFFTAKLVFRTFEATGRLIQATERDISSSHGNPRRMIDLESHRDALVRVRARAKVVRATVRDANREETDRRVSMAILADVEPVLFGEILNRVRSGETRKEILADLANRHDRWVKKSNK